MDTIAKQQTVIKDLWTKETIDLLVKSTVQAFPQALLLMAFILTAVAQYLSRRLLRWSGVEVMECLQPGIGGFRALWSPII